MKKVDLKDLRNILIKTFLNSKIPNNIINLKIDDIKDWDSLGNFNFLLAIEEFYKIKFSIKEISNLKSIKSIYKNLKNK